MVTALPWPGWLDRITVGICITLTPVDWTAGTTADEPTWPYETWLETTSTDLFEFIMPQITISAFFHRNPIFRTQKVKGQGVMSGVDNKYRLLAVCNHMTIKVFVYGFSRFPE